MTRQRQRNMYAFVSLLFLFTPVHAGVVTGVYEYTLSNYFVVIRMSLAPLCSTRDDTRTPRTLAFKRTFTKAPLLGTFNLRNDVASEWKFFKFLITYRSLSRISFCSTVSGASVSRKQGSRRINLKYLRFSVIVYLKMYLRRLPPRLLRR